MIVCPGKFGIFDRRHDTRMPMQTSFYFPEKRPDGVDLHLCAPPASCAHHASVGQLVGMQILFLDIFIFENVNNHLQK